MNGQYIGSSQASSATYASDKYMVPKRKPKMTFKQRIVKWLNSDNYKNEANQTKGIEAPRADEVAAEQAIRFKVIKAQGGTIIETQMYNRRKDQSAIGLYIIHDDQNLGQEIAKIITMEALKA